ncbi:hypothetical protein M2124_001529 [Polynucleobacter sphagniphilus]|nr:hypothetical protein [Polynucleobacter sphagniphilus]
MMNFSIPLVCYLKHLLTNKVDYNKYWISNLYKSSGEFIGYRTINFQNSSLVIETINDKNTLISRENILTVKEDHLDTRINFINPSLEISKFYQIIDSSILECVTTEIGSNILSFETLTTSPMKSTKNLWSDISQHSEWMCFLKDSDHNEIGTRRIYVYDDYSFIDTEFNENHKSQYECLRLVSQSILSQYGSIDRYINHCKILDSDSKTKLSKGGIILDSSESIDEHKRIRNLLKIR